MAVLPGDQRGALHLDGTIQLWSSGETMANSFIVFLFICLVNGLLAEEADLLVETPLGNVQGFYKTSSRGRRYRAFEGIPYAQPPVDDLRFEPPQPFGSWEGTLQTTHPKSRCIQYALAGGYPGKVAGNEDCLYLNIYTPLSNQTKRASQPLPVFFWIHGGGFQFMDGYSQGSTYIMNRDLIYVTFNYRLGILGFMSTEDAVVPGNMGLKDQSLALQWIHQNIIHFGGDPTQITIAGGSAGGVSAHYHYLSPKSAGLFRGGMSFSGTTLNCWAQTEESAAKARKLAASEGCPTTNTGEMVKCLKSRPAASIASLTQQFQPWLMNPFTPFGPVVEKNSSDPFIDRSPVEIIASGGAASVPWVASVVSEEGLFPAAEFVENEELLAELDDKWEELAPHLLDFNFTIPQARRTQVAGTIREHYLGSDRLGELNIQRLIHMVGDRLFSADAAKAATLMAKYSGSSVRFYYYNYRNTFSLTNIFNVTGNFGVSHGDDFNLFITSPLMPVVRDEPTLRVQDRLLDIIESFMTRGAPPREIYWPRVDPSQPYFRYLQISGPEKLEAKSSLNFAEGKFWSSLDFDENKLINIYFCLLVYDIPVSQSVPAKSTFSRFNYENALCFMWWCIMILSDKCTDYHFIESEITHVDTMSVFLNFFLLIILASEFSAKKLNLLVKTPLGDVQGFQKTSSYGRTYRAFEGIPYGKPPVGDLRFEPPQRFGSWKGILQANGSGSACVQYHPASLELPEQVTGNEDCLFLNIYTPSETKKSKSKLPVFFWIYGGSFQFGEGRDEGSSYLMNRDIVYVNFNYRVNILGFLSTEDEVVPGNMGLKDQNLALRWVNENIEYFGGDPNRVTLGGVSAGGSSTHYHYLSPMSRGLFQGGMSFSGTALDNWAQTEGSAEKGQKVGSLLDCPTASSREMVECLKSRPAKSIAQLVGHFQPWLFNPDVPFGPVVEKNSAEPFIDRSPVEIIASGDAADVPWTSTFVSEEGLFPVAEFIEKEDLMATLDEKWEEIAPHLLDFNFTVPVAKQPQVAATIREYYFGGDKIELATAQQLIHMHGHRSFSPLGARLMAKANRSPVWVYYYSYRSPISLTDLFHVTGDYGVSHSDDVFLFIANPGLRTITDQPTLDVQNVLLNIVESFISKGKPPVGIDWPQVDPSNEDLDYLHISGPEELKARSTSDFAEEKFWSSIDFNENKL
ncbi:uncharacterized protein LOC135169494 [Diachasmimorpha longicaudata]|uniref:uncharacterized protein LOC135169494 n=1 Tax=Diachasmimorpha longicaudata TaxID=58733 RepID=UPI0030B8DA07